MKIIKYKAVVIGTDKEVVGYILPIRKTLGNGAYAYKEYDYMIVVNETSSNKGNYGSFLVYEDSIEVFKPCGYCEMEEQVKEFNYLTCSQECYNKL